MPVYELVNGKRGGTSFSVPVHLKNGDTIVLFRHRSKFRKKIERNQPGYGYRILRYRFNDGKLYYYN
jgi:hypothetical protein